MTLIVARIIDNNIYIESDSKVNDPKLVQSDPLCGLLKTLILHPFVCISFAGAVHYAEIALKRFFDEKIENIDQLLDMLLEINEESKNETDFIITTILGKIPKLFKISNRKIERDLLNASIGDHEGFELYQEVYHKLDDKILPQEKMKLAFKSVVNNSGIETIGHFHISTALDYKIEPSHPVFLYQEKTEIQITEPQEIKIEKKGEWASIPLGTTAGGSHGLSYLVTVSPDYHGVAIHYTHGNFGVLFCPQLEFSGTVIKDVDGKEFVEKIKQKYGISLRGIIKNSDTSLQLIDSRDL